ncbi:Methylisocitrate lyase [Phycisphaerae bacterium RAS1]|nr:Methylisocitrate lyase [Phycisphaerae bacterium RAS1]
MNPSANSRPARMRTLLARSCTAMPGATNALTARLIERMGFEAMYLSGAVLANSVIGVPDTGLTTLSEAAAHARRCAAVTTIPIIMDADTGFGESEENAARTVQEYEHAGLAGLHLEDQEFPKRCGHLPGKRLVPADEFCIKLAAAAAARRDKDFVIIARTDARGVTTYDDAVARAHAYLKAGADAIFPEALKTREEFARFARDLTPAGSSLSTGTLSTASLSTASFSTGSLSTGGAGPAPLLANMTEFGQTPHFSVSEFAEMGYRMVIFPVSLQRAAMKAVERVLLAIKNDGGTQSLLGDMQTREELYDLLGYKP